MLARCLEVRYEKGDFYLTQKSRKGDKTTYKNGYIRAPRGNGWANNYKPSRLILHLHVEGNIGYSWIDRYFKDTVGRLTEKRKNIIISTMPLQVEVEECYNSNGERYYVVSEEDMKNWLNRTGLLNGMTSK
ncbi:hypothetical protein ICS_05685 [Bacillus cereus BAG2O-3]|uniref:Uncharacterized protein n=1 Tax=Bacillus fungorum TaxID=2039284 RepID=A0A2G6Q5P1_9BACI|nr:MULTISPECIES: hypothetical protein [Bacillus]EOP02051.1 hypothetical protein ICS_05685 [Bacillus cereus BAG2O-3]MCP1166788.1 hypothetical protein [Bacillus sp. 1813sda1]MDC7973149.1 hypothetical protein [Bacillus sp. BLCC-B18]PIE92156.1 hypothetical protein CO726_28055 [Bacillus fungorum]